MSSVLGLILHVVPTEFSRQLIFSLQILYNAAHFAIKSSILLLYRNIFTLNNRPFRLAWISIFVYVTLCFIIGVIIVVVQCIPTSYAWEVALGAKGRCVNLVGAEIGNGATLAAADIMLLILPMPDLWSLRIALKQKLQICGIFALGSM